jgi:hypothetical protein
MCKSVKIIWVHDESTGNGIYLIFMKFWHGRLQKALNKFRKKHIVMCLTKDNDRIRDMAGNNCNLSTTVSKIRLRHS